MTGQQQRDELHRQIWSIANDVRGAVDGWDYNTNDIGYDFTEDCTFTVTANTLQAVDGGSEILTSCSVPKAN